MRAGSMKILRRAENLNQLLKVIRKDWDMPLRLPFVGGLLTTLKGHYLYEAVVDKWPGFSAVLLRQNQVEHQELKVHEYYLMGREEADVENMLDAEMIIDWGRPFILKNCKMEHLDMILKCGERHGGRFEVPAAAPVHICTYPKFHLLDHFKTRLLPPDFRLGKLLPEHAQIINSKWMYGAGKEMEDQIRHHIIHLPNAGVYHKEKPVSWGLLHRDGSAGYGYTYPDYRRLGLSLIVSKEISRQLEQLGRSDLFYTAISAENKDVTTMHVDLLKGKLYPDRLAFLWFRPHQVHQTNV